MDGTCKTHGTLIMQREVWSKMLRDRNHFEKLGVEGMMLTPILKKKPGRQLSNFFITN